MFDDLPRWWIVWFSVTFITFIVASIAAPYFDEKEESHVNGNIDSSFSKYRTKYKKIE
ncbi:MAG: hypothetical protein K0S38_38 [Candidatus Paceibacter sp.]|jgi:hypothetical protein|nr:hypothetical protein [Candidatus Paceibacter sp.]